MDLHTNNHPNGDKGEQAKHESNPSHLRIGKERKAPRNGPNWEGEAWALGSRWEYWMYYISIDSIRNGKKKRKKKMDLRLQERIRAISLGFVVSLDLCRGRRSLLFQVPSKTMFDPFVSFEGWLVERNTLFFPSWNYFLGFYFSSNYFYHDFV